jgi:plastocyanin
MKSPRTRHGAKPFSVLLQRRSCLLPLAACFHLVAALVVAPGVATAVNYTVAMTNFAFFPKDITVSVGDVITWTNLDPTFHDTTSGTNAVPSGLWHSPLFNKGGSYSVTFNDPPGYYGYYCTPHVIILHMSGSVTVLAPNLPPLVSISAPNNGAVFSAGQSITIRAAASDPDGTVTNVDFFANGTKFGSVSNPPYTTTLPNAAAGSYALTAVATDKLGASTTSASVNITVDEPPLVNITSPKDGDAFRQGTNVLVQAGASDPDGTVSSVEFFTNGASVSLVSTPPYSLLLSNLAVGNYDLSAVATDNLGITTTSSPVRFSVFVPTFAPTITSQPQSQTGLVGSSITFSVIAEGTEPLRYQWRFKGADLAGATSNVLFLPQIETNDAGNYLAVVTNAFGSATSFTASLVVTLPPNLPPTVTITNPVNDEKFPLNTTVNLVADAFDPDGSVAQVEFFARTNFNQTNLLGTVTSRPFVFPLSRLSAGSYSVLARATDNRGGAAFSPEVSFAVYNPPAISLSSSPTNSAQPRGSSISLSVTAGSTNVPVTNIVIFDGASVLAQSSSSPLAFVWKPSTARTYSLTAVASDILGQTSTSAPIAIRIFIPESVRPILAITNAPPNFVRLSSPDVAFAGTASDNVGLDHVEFQINDGTVNVASGTDRWLFITNLVAGLNTIRVRAIDLAGNASFDATRFLTYVVNSHLSVQIEGNGTVTPDLTSSPLEVGKVFTLTAQPAAGQLFGGWGGVTNMNSAVLNFIMEPNLQITAYFVPNIFASVGGKYSGLVADTNNPMPETSGAMQLQLSTKGGFSGKLQMNNASYQFRGQFAPSGKTSLPVLRRTQKPMILSMELDETGDPVQIVGQVQATDGTNSYTSQLLAKKAASLSRSSPALLPVQQSFNLQTAESGQQAAAVESTSAIVTISPTGTVRLRGNLPSRQRFAQTTALAQDLTVPLYIQLNHNSGIVLGWLELASPPAIPIAGSLLFLRPGETAPIMLQAMPTQP